MKPLSIYFLVIITVIASCTSCKKSDNADNKRWYKIDIPMIDSIDALKEIRFVNNDTGYIIGTRINLSSTTDNFVLQTFNGGNTWIINRFFSPDGNAPFTKISVNSVSEIYIAARGVFKLNNINDSWDDLDTNFSQIHTLIAAIDFTNSQQQLVYKGNTIFKYQNTQFQPIFFSSGNVFHDFQRVSNNTLYAATTGLVNSIDGGTTWKESFFTFKIEALSFINDSIGYVLSNHIIYKTIDRGINWVKQSMIPITQSPTNILFLNDKEGYFITQSQEIGYTINGGISWSLEKLPSLDEVPFSNIIKTPDNKIYVTGAKGTLLIKK